MKIEQGISYDLDDLILRPNRSTLKSRKDVNIEREFFFYHSPKKWVGIPLICSNMTSVGTMSVATVLSKYKIITCLHKYYTLDQLTQFLSNQNLDYNWVTVGKDINDMFKIMNLEQQLGKSVNICIDFANGHLDSFVKHCKNIRDRFPNAIILAGNVAISESVHELIIHGGVDIVKIQIGPSSACRTRLVTGVGVGTASCIIDCSSAAHGLKSQAKHLGLVCSDGGCKTVGDITKSLALGADFIMSGKIFAATNACTESEWDGNDMLYYGMSTHKAQEMWNEGKKDHRASEGAIVRIPYQGNLEDILQEIMGGIRSCCTYIGSDSIKDMSKCAIFLQVNKIHSALAATNSICGV